MRVMAATRDHWEDWASCVGADHELFIPRDETAYLTRAIVRRVVRVYCNTCPVTEECKDARPPGGIGIWGGKYHGDRRETIEAGWEP